MRIFIITLCLLSVPFALHAQFDRIVDNVIKNVTLKDATVNAGLKEALSLGIKNVVKSLGQSKGYSADPGIAIAMPDKLKGFEQALRIVGFGPKIDGFMLGMNRVAEKIAPSAGGLLQRALNNLNFSDAKKIAQGSDTAATEYFKSKTYSQLAETLRPLVAAKMNEIGVLGKYNELMASYRALPLVGTLGNFDINQYVTDKALNGFFLALGQQERKIRNDPQAQVTDALQQVFGK
jgi:hypothetical protein